jgi:hypothetical protein
MNLTIKGLEIIDAKIKGLFAMASETRIFWFFVYFLKTIPLF